MKKIPIVGVTLAVIAAGVLSFAVHQRHRLVSMQAGASADQGAAGPAANATAPAPVAARLSEAEHLELLKLRGQVKPMAERQAGAELLARQNARLKEKLAAYRKPAPVPGPDYIRRSDARNRGNESPEAALETFLFAAHNRDTNALFLVLGERMREAMGPELAQKGTEEFFKSQGVIPGIRVVSRDETDPKAVILSVEFIPGSAPMPLKFERGANGWELSP